MSITSGQPIAASDFVSTSAGAGDALKGAKLNAAGKLDETLFDSDLTALKRTSKTASGAIAANDLVYVSAANTVKTINPSAMGTAAAISTAPTTMGACKSLPLSTSGLYLHISGGNPDISRTLKAQVRTLNAAETDFANGTEVNVYTTGNGTRGYDICEIGTDKFLVIFQADTAGAGAGIKAVVLTVSGTTVTVGTSAAIETTGSLAIGCACAKLNTDKGIIFYRKDSDTFTYGQVLTVSGTTITTNTASAAKSAAAGTGSFSACDLKGTDSGIVCYQVASNNNFYARCYTVSGTTITYNTENSLFTSSTSQQFHQKIKPISSTKLLLAYEDQGTPVTAKCRSIAITSAGATLTASSALQLSAANITRYFGMHIINNTYALVGSMDTTTGATLYFLNISGTTPTSISSQGISFSTTSSQYHSFAIVKVAPWTFMVVSGGQNVDGDYIVKLTPASTLILGLAQAAIVDTASGVILTRYFIQTLTGITLTAGAIYYADETGQPTSNVSLTAPRIGFAVSTTTMLVQ